MFLSSGVIAAPLQATSLNIAHISLGNAAQNYLGIGTSSVDKAEFGEAFACVSIDGVGGQAVGWLYDNHSYAAFSGAPSSSYGNFGCKVNGFKNLFSGFVCVYENTINSILGNMLCSVQALIIKPLGAALTLYIICVGLMFLMGIMNVTAKDVMAMILRVVLIMGFATDAELLVELLYRGVMSFVQEGTNAIVESLYYLGGGLTSLSGPGSLLWRLDGMVADFVATNGLGEVPGNECKGAVIEMTMSFLGSVPPLAGMGVAMMFTLMMMLIRTMFGYLIAITGIMFLCAIAPVFLSFALFQFTRSLFDEWVSYLMGFALQVLVVLAFISMIVSLPIQTIFSSLYDLVAPVKSTLNQSNSRLPMKGWCTFCKSTSSSASGSRTCDNSIYPGQNSDALQPSEQAKDVDFIGFSTTVLVFLLVLSRILEATIRVAPQVASGLSSVSYSQKLSSGSTPSIFGGGKKASKAPSGTQKARSATSQSSAQAAAGGKNPTAALVAQRK